MKAPRTLVVAGLGVTLASIMPVGATRSSPENAADTYHCRAGFQQAWVYNEFPEGDVFTIAVRGRNSIRWNGASVTRASLRRRLDSVGAQRRSNFTLLNFTHETDCSLVQEVRLEMTRRLRCAEGRCGELYTTDHPAPRPSDEEMNLLVNDVMGDLANAANNVAPES